MLGAVSVHAVSFEAEDPKTGMTLGELYQLVQQADQLGIDPRTPLTGVRVGFKGQITKAQVTGTTAAKLDTPDLPDITP